MERDYIYNNFRRMCPICGREFGLFDPSIWAYRDRRGKYYCSWKCLCEQKRQAEERHLAVMTAKHQRDLERAKKRPIKTGLPGLKRVRLKAGMTQKELAVSAGICVNSVHLYEMCAADPKPVKVRQLCDALGCTEEDLRRKEE